MNVLVVDYNICNLGSVRRAVESVGGRAVISSDPGVLESAERVILPGVGSFRQAMENLRRMELLEPLRRHVEGGRPLLGLCLGMQLLFSEGREFGAAAGLDFIPGVVERLEGALPVPHVGWNQIAWTRQEPICREIPTRSYFYFVHSYVCRPRAPEDVLGLTDYGEPFVSVVQRRRIWGLQCHPEKSQQPGLTLLRNFLQQ